VAVTQEITHLENSAVKLAFTYNNEDLRAKYNELVNDLAKDIQIKGFRKGKTPIPVLERKLGKALQEDVLNAIIANTVNDAVKKEDFPKDAVPLPYSEPQVEGEPKLDLSGEFTFSVKYDVMPQVTVERWEGLEVEVETAEVTDADVEYEVDAIRERNAIVMDKEDDAVAEKGDVVTVDYSELYEDGEEIPVSKRADFVFTLGSGRNFFKFDDEITGMKKGETRDIQKTYPEEFAETELAGKTKKIRVTMKAVKRRELPDDDELAQDVDETFKTIDDLKQNIRERLKESLREQLRKKKIAGIVEKIVEQAPPVIPESMIEMEMFDSLRQMVGMIDMRNAGTSRFVQELAKDEKFKRKTLKRLQAMLVVEKLLDQADIHVSDEQIEKWYEKIAETSGTSLEEVKENYERESLVRNIKKSLLDDLLLEKNTIKTGKKVNCVDIFSENS
jgi:trigger factor